MKRLACILTLFISVCVYGNTHILNYSSVPQSNASSRQKFIVETAGFCSVDSIEGFATGSFYGFFRPKEESFNEKLEPAIVVSDKKELVNIISSALAGDSNITYIDK